MTTNAPNATVDRIERVIRPALGGRWFTPGDAVLALDIAGYLDDRKIVTSALEVLRKRGTLMLHPRNGYRFAFAGAGPRTLTHDEWLAEGRRRFGADYTAWRYQCPVCAGVQSVRSVLAVRPELTEEGVLTWIHRDCVGRYLTDMGCGHTVRRGRRHMMMVLRGEEAHPVFAFAGAEAASAGAGDQGSGGRDARQGMGQGPSAPLVSTAATSGDH